MCNRICGRTVDTCQQTASCEVFTLNNGRCHTCHRQFNVSCHDKMSTSSALCSESHLVADNNRCSSCKKNTRRHIHSCNTPRIKMTQQKIINPTYNYQDADDDEETVESVEKKTIRHKLLKQLKVISSNQVCVKRCLHLSPATCVSHHRTSFSTVINFSCDQVVNNFVKQSSRVCFNIFKSSDTSINYKVAVILMCLIISLLTCASASPSGKLVSLSLPLPASYESCPLCVSLSSLFFVDTCFTKLTGNNCLSFE